MCAIESVTSTSHLAPQGWHKWTAVEAVVAIRCAVNASDSEDAIRLAAAPLLEVGVVSAGWVDGCVDMVEREGRFILISPDTAVVHARPEDGAAALAVGFARLAHGIPFGRSHGGWVRLVFVVAIPPGKRHDAVLGRLARALMNTAGDQLRAAESDAEASNIVEQAILDGTATRC